MFVQIWVALIIKRSAFPLSLSLGSSSLCVVLCVCWFCRASFVKLDLPLLTIERLIRN